MESEGHIDSLSSRHTRDVGVDATMVSEEQVLEKLVAQLEYYFSRSNLSTDTHLVSQMSSDLFVPVATVASFAKVRALTNNIAMVVRAIQQSEQLVLDDSLTRVRPNFRLERNTVIIRNISSAERSSTLRAFLEQSLGIEGIKELRPEISDNWFLILQDEPSAIHALERVRGQSYAGRPIAARLKSESLLKATASSSASGIRSDGFTSPSPSTTSDSGPFEMHGGDSFGERTASLPNLLSITPDHPHQQQHHSASLEFVPFYAGQPYLAAYSDLQPSFEFPIPPAVYPDYRADFYYRAFYAQQQPFFDGRRFFDYGRRGGGRGRGSRGRGYRNVFGGTHSNNGMRPDRRESHPMHCPPPPSDHATIIKGASCQMAVGRVENWEENQEEEACVTNNNAKGRQSSSTVSKSIPEQH